MNNEFDKNITLKWNACATHNSLFGECARIIGVGAIFIPITFGALGLVAEYPFLTVDEDVLFLHMMLAGTTAWVVNNIVGIFVKRKRPYIQYPKEVVRLINLKLLSKSFPSDHTAIAASCATVISIWSPLYVGALFFIIAISIGFARMSSGLHFFTDIVAGILIGVISALSIQYVLLVW